MKKVSFFPLFDYALRSEKQKFSFFVRCFCLAFDITSKADRAANRQNTKASDEEESEIFLWL
jgi:hypothetical protein